MVVLWVAWAALSWWTTPREVDVAQARADLAAGRVASFEWGDSWDHTGGYWAGRPQLRGSGAPDRVFAWWTPSWRVNYVVLEGLPTTIDGSASSDGGAQPRYSGPQAAALARAVESAAPEAGWSGRAGEPAVVGVTLLLGFLAVSILVLGPAPVRGTRWFWFWLGAGVPFGLGLLCWLAWEHPWSRTAQPPTTQPARDTRLRWYVGIGLAFLAGLAISLVLVLLSGWLGEALVPAVPF